MSREMVSQRVEHLLRAFPQSRESDQVLYALYVRKFADFEESELVAKMLGKEAPSFDSIGRARRKLQAENPSLRPPKEVQEHRKIAEKEWGEWAIS